MPPTNRSTLLEAVREHNMLNGFEFIIAEFLIVMGTALFISWSGFLHGAVLIEVAGAGIALNALVVCVIAILQLRRTEPEVGIMKLRSKAIRDRVDSERPGLNRRTLYVAGASLAPFLLVILLIAQRPR